MGKYEKLIQTIEILEQLLKETKEDIYKLQTHPESGALNEAPSMELIKELPGDKVIRRYEQIIGLATPSVAEGIDFVIEKGMAPELVIRIIEYACEQGVRRWQYINKILIESLKENILSLEDYNRHQAERTERTAEKKTSERKPKKSKFNNYTDTNTHDYSNFQEKILKEMLEE